MCYAAFPKDTGDKCWGVFTGDTLFVGDTGRTDLSDPDKTGENAGVLYDSVHTKIAPLGDQALVLPAHGSGSACGGNISDRDDTTLGIEKDTNPVFKKARLEFIGLKVSEHLPRPPYFVHMEQINLGGGRVLPGAVGDRTLTPHNLEKRMQEGIVIDTRRPDAFAGAHIGGSYNIWLDGLSSFGGWFADERTVTFLVVQAADDAPTAIAALARIGIDSVEGILVRGVDAWREAGLPIESLGTTSVRGVAEWRKEGRLFILDVRDDMEWEKSHIPEAHHTYVGYLEKQLPQIPKDQRIVVHCSVGNRSGIAASVLMRHGFRNVFNMLGGMTAWENLDLPFERNA